MRPTRVFGQGSALASPKTGDAWAGRRELGKADGSWRGAGPQQGQAGDCGQLDHAAIGLDERDAERARAAAVRTGGLPGFGVGRTWRRRTPAPPCDGRAGLGNLALADLIGAESDGVRFCRL